MIKACLIILTCYSYAISDDPSKRASYACAFEARKIVSVRFWDKYSYRLILTNKEDAHIKETPFQVAEKVQDCK